MHLSIYLSVLESISLSHTHTHTHTHTHICAHSHSLLLFWTDQIKSDTQTPKDVFHTYSSTAPPPRHTKTQTKTFVSNTLTLLTHACVDASTNKQTNTHFGQICSWCQTRPADPPPNNSPHNRFTEVMLGQHLPSPIPPPPVPSKSPLLLRHPPPPPFVSAPHTYTHTRYLAFLLPNLSPIQTVSPFRNIVISHSAAAYPYSTYFVVTIVRDVLDSNTMVLFYIPWYLAKKALWW